MLIFPVMQIKNNAKVILLLVIWITVSSCTSTDDSAIPQFTWATNAFAIDLYKQLIKSETNIVCSPFSLATAIAMVVVGSRGTTQQEIYQVLHFPSGVSHQHLLMALKAILHKTRQKKHIGYELYTARSLWIPEGTRLSIDYEKVIKDFFDAYTGTLSFQDRYSIRKINHWVSHATNNKVGNLFENPFDPLTRVVVVDVIYFNGEWLKPFDALDTDEKQFFNAKGRADVHVSIVPTMQKFSSFPYTFSEFLNAQVLEMQYQKNETSMVIILPAPFEDLYRLESKLSADVLTSVFANLTMADDVDLSIPKFKIDAALPLKNVLSNLGMKEAFNNSADLSAITGTKNLRLSEVVQKAIITVDEKGTEAAAASDTSMILLSMPNKLDAVQFHVDRPFIYLIKLKPTDLILFMGRVVAL